MTPEQEARDLLEAAGVEDAQSMSSGDLVGIANLIAEVRDLRSTVYDMRLEMGACGFGNHGPKYLLPPAHRGIYTDDDAAAFGVTKTVTRASP